MKPSLAQFENQTYLNLQTFRRDGRKVNTPLWFVLTEDRVYIRTISNSGKVKRIRNNNLVNIMPCGVNGEPLGSWVSAKAYELKDDQSYARMAGWMAEKYGNEPRLYEEQAKSRGENYTVIEILVEGK
jgi:uncharacterized protein